jgi:aspartyl protease family protein
VSGGDQALSLVYFLLLLVLVGSGLAVRRAPLGKTLKMALIWVLIFAVGFAVVALKDDFRALGGRMLAELNGEAGQEVRGQELRIRRANDGHFWVDGEINGRPLRFLVDSGATVTTITEEIARGAGIDASGGPGVMVETANGPALFRRGRAASLRIGPIARADFRVHIAASLGDTNVLGMNFLSSLSGWSVEGNMLVLRP